jgi:biopolymer transport protein ExbD
MRVPSHHSRGAVGFNMTPMIDVVFLLIIFFLVSSHLARQEVQMKLDLPDAGTGQRPDEDEHVRRIVVNVLPEPRAGGQVMVGGRAMRAGELGPLIEYERDQAREAPGGPTDLEVRIRTDRRAPYRLVEPIMVACADARVWRVTFAVVEK